MHASLARPHSVKRFLVMLFVCWLVIGCAARPSTPGGERSGVPLERFTVLTYNTLHGLQPSGLTVKAGESKEARQTRLRVQYQQMSAVQPEVMLLQEVNPLPEMAEAYVTAMNDVGLEYTEVHQVDACGMRLAPGLAVVPGLNNGLAVLVKAPLKLRKIKGLKLSGGIGRCDDYVGMQTGELRYALIAEVENPNTGRKVLAVSLHLHSGIERNAFFIRKINEAVEQGRARREDLEPIVAAMEKDLERRLEELRVLIREIRALQAEGSYLGAIIGGDCNFEPGDPEYRELARAGLRDTYMIANPHAEVYSLDPERNQIAGEGVREVPAALREAMARLPDSEQQKIIEGYRKGVGQARRVDFLFLMKQESDGPQAGGVKGCLRQELFGEPATISGQPGSDHYGVLDTYIADASQCEQG